MTVFNESALLVYLTVIVFLTYFKYKVRGFTFNLLLALEVVVIANFIKGILEYTYLVNNKLSVLQEDYGKTM